MSKKLIAGAGVVASFAIALAPLATFADPMPASDQHADELVVTVLPSCTFGSAKKATSPYPGGITHDDSTGDYDADGSASAANTRSATAWNSAANTTTDASGALHSATDTTDHLTGDKASTGYGILEGESGLTSTNSSTLANSSEHTVHRSMYAGIATPNFAQTTMWVVCNNGDGYSITAAAAPLTNGTVAEDIAVTTSAIAASTAAATSNYNGVVTTNDASEAMTNLANIPASEGIIAKKAGVSKEDGDSLTVTYGMSIKTSQKADTYAGKVTYKLYKGVNGANNS